MSVPDCIHPFMEVPQYAWLVMDTAVVQRLRFVKQLGAVNEVWPCANHTRFEHSLGVMYLALEYAKHFQCCISEEDTRAFVLAALLHDIGHGPFSHTFESVIKGTPCAEKFVSHDHWRYQLIDHNEELVAAIGSKWTIEHIKAIWRGKDPKWRAFHLLLEGPLGVDRMDYILRDWYYIRPDHSPGLTKHLVGDRFDRACVSTIIANTAAHFETGEVIYAEDALEAIARLLHTRFFLYSRIYLHPKAQAADMLLHQCMSKGWLHSKAENMITPGNFENFDDDFIRCESDMQAFKKRQLPKLVFDEDDLQSIKRNKFQDGTGDGTYSCGVASYMESEFDNIFVQMNGPDAEVHEIVDCLPDQKRFKRIRLFQAQGKGNTDTTRNPATSTGHNSLAGMSFRQCQTWLLNLAPH